MSGVTITLVNPDRGLLARSPDEWRPSPGGGGRFVLSVPAAARSTVHLACQILVDAMDADLAWADWSDGQSVWVPNPDREVS